MLDIPFFTTENGVASLILSQIPYRKTAYISVLSSYDIGRLIQEAADFCRTAGAERIYAGGTDLHQIYPKQVSILKMIRHTHGLPDTDACLIPVTDETAERWRTIYNERMEKTETAVYKGLYGKALPGQCYFIHRNGELLGIGSLENGHIGCLASVKKGSGRDVLLALCHGIFTDTVSLEAADTNCAAIDLYTREGFIPTEEIITWYDVSRKNT